MEDLYYITPKGIGLEDIARCAREAGYAVTLNMAGSDRYLLVSFECFYGDELTTEYWRWNHLWTDNQSYDEKDCKRRRRLKPKNEFHIAYPFFTMPAMLPFLQCLLESHTGWIETNFGYEKYTADNLEELLNLDSDSRLAS